MKKSSLWLTRLICLTSFLLLPASRSLAETAFDPNTSKIPIAQAPNFLSVEGINDALTRVADILLNNLTLIAGILAVFYLIFAGIRYITSGGDAKKVEQARMSIIHVIIGVAVIVASYFIIRLAVGIGNTLVSSPT